MPNRRNDPRAPRGRDRSASDPRDEKLDLLEIGPEDGAPELLELEDGASRGASIKVVGVGGGGGNALDNMISSGLSGVEFIAANTDLQALQKNAAPMKLQLGTQVTRGLGCGANPERGKAAAVEDQDRLREVLEGTDMVFVTAGLGGGTGTGAAPVVAEIAREVGALTVAVVTKPFQFEGRVRSRQAERGLDELHRVVDTLITIPNHRLLALAGKGTRMQDAFKLADDVLFNAVRGISDLITVPGLINLDFADVRTIMNEMGMALMGTGVGRGETRAAEAARGAISSPLLEDLSIDGAHGVLINVTGGSDMTLYEVNEASSLIHEAAHEEANIIFGAVVDEGLEEEEMRVTVIATGLEDDRLRRRPPERHDMASVTPLRRDSRSSGVGSPAAERRDDPGFAAREETRPYRGGEREGREEAGLGSGAPSASRASSGPRSRPGSGSSGPGSHGDDWVSPFEDELDVPAFLRRGSSRKDGEDDEEDRELPAFLRRSAD